MTDLVESKFSQTERPYADLSDSDLSGLLINYVGKPRLAPRRFRLRLTTDKVLLTKPVLPGPSEAALVA